MFQHWTNVVPKFHCYLGITKLFAVQYSPEFFVHHPPVLFFGSDVAGLWWKFGARYSKITYERALRAVKST